MLLVGYGIGCIQTAYITGRLVKDIDVREHGSGNAGMTNVTRVVGRRAGLVVFVLDVLKAIGAFVFCSWAAARFGVFELGYYSYLLSPRLPIEPGLWAGLGVLLGHNFPAYLGFRGGKGVASFLGLMLVIDWRVALAVYLIGTAIVLTSRYISLASLTMVLLFPIGLFFMGYSLEIVVIIGLMTAMTFYLHRGNIQRLIAGNERKFGTKEDKPQS